MVATDIAIVGFAQKVSEREASASEIQLLVPVITEALASANLPRSEGLTCARKL